VDLVVAETGGARPPGRVRRLLRAAVRVTVAGTAGALVAVTAFAAHVNVHRPKTPNSEDPAKHGLSYRDIRFSTTDGLTLAGWLVASRTAPPRGAVLICHGVGANRDDVLPRARFLAAAGYTCFLFDFRCHGDSGGDKVSFGVHERRDVRAALDVVLREAPGLPIAVLAQSMGAATAVLAAREIPEVSAFVLDSSFATLWEMARENFKRLPVALTVPFQYLVSLWGSILIGHSILDVSPEAEVEGLAPRPVFFIHGDADEFIPKEHSVRLHRRYSGPKEIWLVPGAVHVASHATAGAEFERRVVAFLGLHSSARPR
jgi:pimeloyl-ACP methyl ester carboxylesterase